MIQFCFGSSSDYSAALRQLGGTRCFLRPVFRSHTRHLQDRHRKLSSAEAGPGLTSTPARHAATLRLGSVELHRTSPKSDLRSTRLEARALLLLLLRSLQASALLPRPLRIPSATPYTPLRQVLQMPEEQYDAIVLGAGSTFPPIVLLFRQLLIPHLWV